MKNYILFFTLLVLAACSSNETKRQDPNFEKRAREIISQMTLEEKVGQMVNTTIPVERLNIKPYDWWNEALHGVARNGRATIFPQSVALAATFDDALVKEVATAISDEARAKFNVSQEAENYNRYTGLSFWSPNVKIYRDPRWGRGQETYGEDPYLTGRIGVAFVKGMQGDDPHYLKTAACAKHFAVHSGPEALRHHFNAIPSRKDLFETYLPAFEMLVKDAKVESVMGAYNRVYGHSASASHFLLTEILRDEWGFEGHILSDCGAVKDIYEGHGIAKDAAEASAIALRAGLDMNCGESYLALGEAVKRGLVEESEIDDALCRLYVTRLKLGLLNNADENPYNNIPAEVVGCEDHIDLARKCAAKSMVLVSNKNNTLPLSLDLQSIGVTGPFAADNFILMGNYFGVTNHMTSFVEGIVDVAKLTTRVAYSHGIQAQAPNLNPNSWIDEEVVSTDACIVAIGISSNDEGEEGAAIASESIGDRLSMKLPEHHIKYLRDIRNMCKGKLIAVVTGCSAMDLSEVEEIADAVIWAWYPGQEGGGALADIIFGKVSPSGRMPLTIPQKVEDLPAFEDYTMIGRTYKYMTKPAQYPFGYGLSYTTFDYSNVKLSDDSTLKVEFDVTNSGNFDSDEVAQVYLSTPNAGKGAPISSLVGFERLNLTKGGITTISVEIKHDQLCEIDEFGEKQLREGTYTLHIGNISPSERSKELGGKWVDVSFNVNAEGKVIL